MCNPSGPSSASLLHNVKYEASDAALFSNPAAEGGAFLRGHLKLSLTHLH